eukprot:4814157-Amphidinium_carterae.1
MPWWMTSRTTVAKICATGGGILVGRPLASLHQTHLVPTLVLVASTGQTTSCAASSCVHSNGGTRSAHLG